MRGWVFFICLNILLFVFVVVCIVLILRIEFKWVFTKVFFFIYKINMLINARQTVERQDPKYQGFKVQGADVTKR